MEWKLADAKNRFSELVTEALTNGPQRVTRRDQAVIILSEHEYEELVGTRPNFIEFLLNGPDFSELDLTRDTSLMRDIEL
jgi:prevent-host-death family protein